MKVKALLLAAGLGTRLRPLTNHWPKCLMPIGGRPLLEYWLHDLKEIGVEDVLVNMHYFNEIFESFLGQETYQGWVTSDYEKNLLGTAGTLRKHYDYYKDATVLLVHADNFCQCDLGAFIEAHNNRPSGTVMTMMTFTSPTPETCGIVELSDNGIVQTMHEKVENPPGNKANAAVYLLEPEILDWIKDQNGIFDFSTEVLPRYFGKMYSWHNGQVHRDIGNVPSLKAVQNEIIRELPEMASTDWNEDFKQHDIHRLLNSIHN